MAGPSSQNAPTRDSGSEGQTDRGRRIALAVIGGLTLLIAAGLAVEHFPESELGRTLHSHLSQLADPRSWMY